MSSDEYRGDVATFTRRVRATFRNETRKRNVLAFLPAISRLGFPWEGFARLF